MALVGGKLTSTFELDGVAGASIRDNDGGEGWQRQGGLSGEALETMSYYVQEPWYENMGGLAPEQVDAGMLDYDKNQDMGWASPAYDFQVAAEDTVQYES